MCLKSVILHVTHKMIEHVCAVCAVCVYVCVRSSELVHAYVCVTVCISYVTNVSQECDLACDTQNDRACMCCVCCVCVCVCEIVRACACICVCDCLYKLRNQCVSRV